MKNICIFCGSRQGQNLELTAKAADLGRAIAQEGHQLIFGGGRFGLMGTISQAAIEARGKVIGITPTGLASREPVQHELTELHVVDDLVIRKRMMIDRSDIFIVLPGGLGTLDELFEVWTGKQVNAHVKPIIIANWGNYYDKLFDFLKQAHDDGFLHEDHTTHVEIVDSVEEIIAAINQFN